MEMDIRLEKNVYYAGETAKGTLLIKADKSLKVRKLEFSVCGKERYGSSWFSSIAHYYILLYFLKKEIESMVQSFL
jgi:hypothetical protein